MTKSVSPNGKHTYETVFAGRVDVRFGQGPDYYNPVLNGHKYGATIVGDVFTWSPDSRYLAMQEWLTVQEDEGPITSVKIINLEENGFRDTPAKRGPMSENFNFEGDKFSYEKKVEKASPKKFSIELDKVKEWQKLK